MRDWPRPPLGSLVETIVPARDKPEELDGPIPWVRIEDFDGKWIEGSRSGQGVSPETIARMNLRAFPAGTVACTCSCNMGTTAIVRRPLVTNQTFIGLRPRSGALLPEFLYYSLGAHRDELNAQATGAIQSYLSRDDFRRLRLPIPPPAEQRAIADYLDTETAHIDALIAKKRRLLSALQERRQGTVDEAVHAGDEVALRRLISRLTSGPRGWADHVSDAGETPFLRITNIRRTDIELDRRDLVRVISPRNAEATRTAVRENDVLVSITADIGSVGIARARDAGAAVSQHVALLTPEGCEPEWLAYSITSSAARHQLDAGQYGGTKTQLSLGDVASLKIRVPTSDEQRRRLLDLRRRLGRLGSASDALRRQVALLREHRQALITAAVTGELEIPGVA